MESEKKSSQYLLENAPEPTKSEVDLKNELANSDLKLGNELLRIQIRKNTKDLIKFMFILSLATVIIILISFYIFLKLLLH